MKLYEVFDSPVEADSYRTSVVHRAVFIINKKTGETLPTSLHAYISELVNIKDLEKKYQDAARTTYPVPRTKEERKLHNEIIEAPWRKMLSKVQKLWEEISMQAFPVDADLHRQLRLSTKVWEVHFSSSDEPEHDISKLPRVLIGTGNSIKKFSTVINFVKKVLSESNINHILITAYKNEPSRIRLYDRLTKPVLKKRWDFDNVVYWLV